LIVEGLHGAGDEVVAADETLFVVFVVFVFLLDFCVLHFVADRGQVEGVDRRGFLEEDGHIFLEVFDRQIFVVLLFSCKFFAFDFGFGVDF